MSAPKRLFIFYNSFSLWLTEYLHEQKYFLKQDLHVLFVSFFFRMYNKEQIFTLIQSPQGDHPVINRSLLVISIVIESDRGHCYGHFKKINVR